MDCFNSSRNWSRNLMWRQFSLPPDMAYLFLLVFIIFCDSLLNWITSECQFLIIFNCRAQVLSYLCTGKECRTFVQQCSRIKEGTLSSSSSSSSKGIFRFNMFNKHHFNDIQMTQMISYTFPLPAPLIDRTQQQQQLQKLLGRQQVHNSKRRQNTITGVYFNPRTTTKLL